MHTMRKSMPILLLTVFTLMLVSCSQPADEEIMAAEDAIKAAKMAGAEEKSARLFGRANELLQQAKMANEQGNYKEARKQASFAKLRAEESKKLAESLGRPLERPHHEGGGGEEAGGGGE